MLTVWVLQALDNEFVEFVRFFNFNTLFGSSILTVCSGSRRLRTACRPGHVLLNEFAEFVWFFDFNGLFGSSSLTVCFVLQF